MELGGRHTRGDVWRAACLEAAWRLVPDDGVALLSVANMHAKFPHAQLAVGLYQWLLQQPRLRLPPHAASMAQRKLQELAQRGAAECRVTLPSKSGPHFDYHPQWTIHFDYRPAT